MIRRVVCCMHINHFPDFMLGSAPGTCWHDVTEWWMVQSGCWGGNIMAAAAAAAAECDGGSRWPAHLMLRKWHVVHWQFYVVSVPGSVSTYFVTDSFHAAMQEQVETALKPSRSQNKLNQTGNFYIGAYNTRSRSTGSRRWVCFRLCSQSIAAYVTWEA